MKKVFFFLAIMAVLTSCSNEMDNTYYEPFVVTGIVVLEKNPEISNYFEKGENYTTMGDFVVAPTGKYQIGDTIPEASIRHKL